MNVSALLARIATLPPRVRTVAAVAVAAVVGLSIVCGVLTHPPRVSLFATPLDAAQINEVQEQLAAWNVPFTPVAGNIVVDAGRRNDVLLRLSLAGLPHEHVTSTGESLAGIGVLTPQSVVDAQTRAGLAGDIASALRSVAGVEDARVIIAPARTAQYADETSTAATASVRLRLHPGARVGAQEVAGIRAFVASSVEGLDASHVTVLDDDGVALDDTRAQADAGDLQRALQSALDGVFGSGAAIARVHVDTDRRESERRDVLRAPAANAPLAQSATREAYNDGSKHYQKSEETDDRGSDVRESVTRIPAGAVTRITAAVFIDRARQLDEAAVEQLAAATIGIDRKRGDTLDVAAIAFSGTGPPAASAWLMLYGAIAPALPVALVLGAAALFVRRLFSAGVSVLRPLVERARIVRTSETVSGFAPAQVRGALAGEPPHAAAAVISALPAATAAAVLELYPPNERDAIVRRMQRPHSPFMPGLDEVLRCHV